MKKLITLAVLLGGLFTFSGCQQTGAFSGLGGAGESWEFINPIVSANGPLLTIKADRWTHIGKDGATTVGTNALPTVTVGKP